jgi:hypothetical protein
MIILFYRYMYIQLKTNCIIFKGICEDIEIEEKHGQFLRLKVPVLDLGYAFRILEVVYLCIYVCIYGSVCMYISVLYVCMYAHVR